MKKNTPEKPKRVLIITYYWPPSGGSPVLRWLNFVHYLAKAGYQCVIYTPENPIPQAIDESLTEHIPADAEVIKTRITEPGNLISVFSGKKKDKTAATALISEKGKTSKLQSFSVWVRGNFFIPDARMLWIRPSVKFLKNYLQQKPCDLIISTGPPHSMHLIAKDLKHMLGTPWIADFRDPWTNIDYYKDLRIGKSADRRHKRLEKAVLDEADRVITVGPTMTREFEEITSTRVETITNGFNDEIMQNINAVPDEKFTILHVGSMPQSRNPEGFWHALGSLCKRNADLRQLLNIELIGKVDHSVIRSLRDNNLEEFLNKRDSMLNREVLARMKSAAVLLLVVNNTANAQGILTNKFFEYLSARRPVLAIGPEQGDLAEILAKANAGQIFNYSEVEQMQQHLEGLFEMYKAGELSVNTRGIEKYSRRNLTKALIEIIQTLVK